MKQKEKDNNLLSEKRKKLYAKYLRVIGVDVKYPEIQIKGIIKYEQNNDYDLQKGLTKIGGLNLIYLIGLMASMNLPSSS